MRAQGVVNLAGVFGGETGGPLTDSMQSLADEVGRGRGLRGTHGEQGGKGRGARFGQ